ncbi:DUF4411 family protein [Ancylobacter sp. 6x-1]|uniref:DUF4411 family protein n=1 Tax=Ancylobacter crimeensis TaxID=2579147 RepID=A0ABT0DG84_9HYPH|nr:DUF4411 family protein [Ancylobacter crimeensis]MCK0198976.1 DUF4411 family protein [Ancylobacter crimeensis]
MSASSRPHFVWDTSALVAAWVERYPIDVLPALWDRLIVSIQAGEMIAPEEVKVELGKRSTDLLDFLRPCDDFFTPTDGPVLADVAAILAKHPKLVMERKRAFAADPFVIATARISGAVIVTEEGRGSPGKPKIPDVCDAYGVECINLLDLIRKVRWKF